MSGRADGELVELHRWPVKSMAGEPVAELSVDRCGAGGDRTHAVYDRHKGLPRRLTARQAPRLLAWTASYPNHPGAALDPAAPPEPVLRAPDGLQLAWGDPRLPEILSADLGRDVELRSDSAGQQDLGETVLVTIQSTLEAVAVELGCELDLRRFRTNLHVALDAPAFAENGWEGGRITVGEAELELLHPCRRCAIPTRSPDTQEKWGELLRHLFREHGGIFGINARPLGRATVRIGDPVAIG